MEARQRAIEERRLARQVERAALAEQARERRRQAQCEVARRFRALHPDKKREQDQRYRASNREKVRTQRETWKQRAKAEGRLKSWKPPPESIERRRERENAVTAAVAYLRSVGLFEWWGSKETTAARREAAYVYVREQGLL
jgi:hypothetical protein